MRLVNIDGAGVVRLDVLQFANAAIPTLAKNAAEFEGYPDFGWSAMLADEGLRGSFSKLTECIGFTNTYAILKKVDGLFDNCLDAVRVDSSDVDKSMEKIDSLDDPVSRAVAMFCYVAGLVHPVKGYKTLALVMANKILIESLSGYLTIPVSEVASFTDKLESYVNGIELPDTVVEMLRGYIQYA